MEVTKVKDLAGNLLKPSYRCVILLLYEKALPLAINSSEASRQSQKACSKKAGKRRPLGLQSRERCAFGARYRTDKMHCVAYRTATGDLRFLPI